MSGGPGRKPRVADDEIIKIFRETDDPVLSTAEVAEEIPIGRRGTLKRLQALVETGPLESKPIGGRNTVWWLSEDDIAESDSSPPSITGQEAKVDIYEELNREVTEADSAAAHPGIDTLISDIVDDGVLPGSGEKLEKRRQALHATVEYLREERRAEPKDFRENVYPEHTAEYTQGEDPPNSWWKNCVYKGMRELAERSDEIKKPDQSGEWVYTGE